MKSKVAKIPFDIGDRVRITHITTLGYDANYYRVATVSSRVDIIAVVVGAVNRPLGRYHKAQDYTGGESDAPYLKVSRTIQLVQCKTRLFGKCVEAQLDHVSKVE